MSRASTAATELEDAVGQRRLAVVDVGDDRQVAQAVEGVATERTSLLAVWRAARRLGYRLPVPLEEHRSPTRSGEHQESDQAQPAERSAPSRNKAVRSEIKTRVKVAVAAGRGRRRGRSRRAAPGGEAPRQGRGQGHHPQEPGRQPQVAPDEATGQDVCQQLSCRRSAPARVAGGPEAPAGSAGPPAPPAPTLRQSRAPFRSRSAPASSSIARATPRGRAAGPARAPSRAGNVLPVMPSSGRRVGLVATPAPSRRSIRV